MDIKERKKLKKKEKKEKKEKDPNKPKRPPTAYLLWMSDNRDNLKEQFPGLSITDLSKKGGELWKELSVSEKEVGNLLNKWSNVEGLFCILLIYHGCVIWEAKTRLYVCCNGRNMRLRWRRRKRSTWRLWRSTTRREKRAAKGKLYLCNNS